MKLFTVLGFVLLTVFSCFTQEEKLDTSNYSVDVDTNYVKVYDDFVVVRSFLQNKFNALTVRGAKRKRELRYSPNGVYNFGVGIGYDWLGLEVGFQVPESEDDERKYGVTKSWGLVTSMYMREFMVDVSLIRYNGYYNREVNDRLGLDTIIKRSDIRTTNIGASANYILNNKRFSFRAAYLQNESQLKSAGTVFSGIYLYRTEINSDKGFIPEFYKNDFPNIQDVKRALTWQIGLQLGYAYTFVVNKFYFMGSGSLGGGYANRSFSEVKEKKLLSEEEIVPKAQLRFATGFDVERFTVGLQGVIDVISVGGFEQYSINYSFGSVKLFAAYRFKATKHFNLVKKLDPFNLLSK